jgi:release factor glutamine methyltransferase
MVESDPSPPRCAGRRSAHVSDVLLRDLLAQGAARIEGEDARRESELLLEHALQRERAWLFAHARDAVDPSLQARFFALVDRRVAGEPVAYLIGRRGFWNLDLEVSSAVLVPRPETELLVEAALACVPLEVAARIADLGTGSGAIALALAQDRPVAHVVATDASEAALAVARGNARRLAIANVEFRAGSWYAPLAGERFDLIASNPPYIAEGDPHVTRGDLRFEPPIALTSGADGLDAIRILTAGATQHLHPGGWLLIEHGYDQGGTVRALFATVGLTAIGTRADLAGHERVTLGRAPG